MIELSERTLPMPDISLSVSVTCVCEECGHSLEAEYQPGTLIVRVRPCKRCREKRDEDRKA